MKNEEVSERIRYLLIRKNEIEREILSYIDKCEIFNYEDCPLRTKDINGRDEHYNNSLSLFGLSNYKWRCKFCGEEDYD